MKRVILNSSRDAYIRKWSFLYLPLLSHHVQLPRVTIALHPISIANDAYLTTSQGTLIYSHLHHPDSYTKLWTWSNTVMLMWTISELLIFHVESQSIKAKLRQHAWAPMLLTFLPCLSLSAPVTRSPFRASLTAAQLFLRHVRLLVNPCVISIRVCAPGDSSSSFSYLKFLCTCIVTYNISYCRRNL